MPLFDAVLAAYFQWTVAYSGFIDKFSSLTINIQSHYLGRPESWLSCIHCHGKVCLVVIRQLNGSVAYWMFSQSATTLVHDVQGELLQHAVGWMV